MKGEVLGYDHFGRGIVKCNGKVVFVPYCKKGEIISFAIVDEKRQYAIGENLEKKRSVCPFYSLCGGCQILHLSYPEQLLFKQEKVKNILKRYTKYDYEKEIPILSTEPFFYRNKVVLHIEEDRLGFYQEESQKLVPFAQCLLLKKEMQEAILKLREYIQTRKGLEEAMIRILDGQVMLVLKGKADVEEIRSFFLPFCHVLFLNGQALTKEKKLKTTIFDTTFLVSKDAFFQVNDLGLRKIYQVVLDWVKSLSYTVAFDLYCGTGTLSLLLASYVQKVYGVELSKEAILDAKENQGQNRISNVSFFASDVGHFLQRNKATPDLIVVDPPRAGLAKNVRRDIKKRRPAYLIYVSCDPMTLARDIEDLREFYFLEDVIMVDEFPNTYHVECLCLLKRKE